MAENWSFSWNHSGSTQTRTLTPSSPELADNYRRITRITRRCGQYCYTGGGDNTVGLGCYDELIDSRTGVVILTSTTESCEVKGGDPFGSTSYMTTEFNDIPVAESHLILAAWRAGALQIKRTLWIRYYDSRRHGNPYFRSEYSDKFSFEGTDSAYRPGLEFTTPVKTTDERLYALSWAQPPFDFGIKTQIEPSEYWEDAASLHRRLEISAVNLSRTDVPPMEDVFVSTASPDSTEWNVTQAQFTFLRSEHGFLRGCRYRIDFTFRVGRSADSLTESATLSVEIDKAQVPLHLTRHGRGVAIGQYSGLVEEINGEETEDTLFECAYPSKFYGEMEIQRGGRRYVQAADGGIQEMMVGRWYDGRPIRRFVLIGSKDNDTDSKIGALPAVPDTVLSVRGGWKATRNGYFYPISFSACEDGAGWSIGIEIRPTATGADIWALIGSEINGGDFVVIIDYLAVGDPAVVMAAETEEE